MFLNKKLIFKYLNSYKNILINIYIKKLNLALYFSKNEWKRKIKKLQKNNGRKKI